MLSLLVRSPPHKTAAAIVTSTAETALHSKERAAVGNSATNSGVQTALASKSEQEPSCACLKSPESYQLQLCNIYLSKEKVSDWKTVRQARFRTK